MKTYYLLLIVVVSLIITSCSSNMSTNEITGLNGTTDIDLGTSEGNMLSATEAYTKFVNEIATFYPDTTLNLGGYQYYEVITDSFIDLFDTVFRHFDYEPYLEAIEYRETNNIKLNPVLLYVFNFNNGGYAIVSTDRNSNSFIKIFSEKGEMPKIVFETICTKKNNIITNFNNFEYNIEYVGVGY